MPRPFPRSALVALLVCLYACRAGEDPIAPPETLAPISEDEARDFGEKLQLAISGCDRAALSQMIDMDAMMRAAVWRSAVGKRWHAKMMRGLQPGANELISAVCTWAHDEKTVRFLRLREQYKRQALLVSVSAKDSLQYVGLYVGKRSSGEIVSDDLYFFASGQSGSANFAQTIDRLRGKDSDSTKLSAIAVKLEGDPELALTELRALPKKLLDSKQSQILLVAAASFLDVEVFRTTLADYQSRFPNDPAADLASLVGLANNAHYNDALQAMDRLAKIFDGDPYLDYLRASILLADGGDLDRAASLCEKALVAAPQDRALYELLVAIRVANHDAPGAVDVIGQLAQRFHLQLNEQDIDATDEDLREFAASSEWQAYRERVDAQVPPHANGPEETSPTGQAELPSSATGAKQGEKANEECDEVACLVDPDRSCCIAKLKKQNASP